MCGAHNFAVGDLVVVVLPGGVLPGGFEISARKTYGHLSAGMICSATELGLGDEPRRASSCCRPTRGSRATTPSPAPPARRGDRVRDQSRPCLRAVAAWGRPRGGAGVRRAVHRPRRARRPPSRTATGYPVRGGGPDGCPVFVTRTVTGFDPTAPTPALAGAAAAAGRDAPDLARRRRHQLRDARAGPADPRLRRRQAAGADRVRRAAEGERLTTLDGSRPHALDRGPADHRRLRADRPRRGHGRRDHRAVGDHDRRGHRGRALRPGRRSSAPRSGTSCRPRRPSASSAASTRSSRRGRRPRGRAARRRYGGGTVDARRDRGRRARPSAAAIRIALRPAGPDHRDGHRRRHHGRAPRGRRLHGAHGGHGPHRDPAAVAARPHRPVRPGRGGGADRRLRQRPVGAAGAPPGPRPDPRAAAAPPDRAHAGRCRLRRGGQLPVRRRRRLRRAGAARGRPARADGAAGQPALQRGAVVHDDPAARAVRAAARNVGRGAADVALFETGTVAFPPTAGPRRSTASTGARPTTSWPSCSRRCPPSRCTSPSLLRRRRERAGWWGEGRTADWADAIDGVRRRRRALGVEVDVAAASRRPGTPAAAPSCRSAARSSGTPASCTRKVCQAFGLPPRTAVPRSTSTS